MKFYRAQIKHLLLMAFIMSCLVPAAAQMPRHPKPKPKPGTHTPGRPVKSKKAPKKHKKSSATPVANKTHTPNNYLTSSGENAGVVADNTSMNHINLASTITRGVQIHRSAIRDLSEAAQIGLSPVQQQPLPVQIQQTIEFALKPLLKKENTWNEQQRFMTNMFRTHDVSYWFSLSDAFLETGVPVQDVLAVSLPYAPVVGHVLGVTPESTTLAKELAQKRELYLYPQTVLVVARTIQQEPKAINDMLLQAVANQSLDSAGKLVDVFQADPNYAFQHYFSFDIWHDYGFSNEAVKFLLDNQADVNQEVFDSFTKPTNTRAIHQVVHYNAFELLHMLKNRGADINAPDGHGNTALHLAVERLDALMVENLISAGARPDIANRAGLTPRQLFKQRTRRHWQLKPNQKVSAQRIKKALN